MNNKTITLRVPATSANLGSGFDTMGIAFDIYNTLKFKVLEDSRLVIRGVEPEFQNQNNLIYQSALEIFKRADYFPKGLLIEESNEIPFGKGLGSSAACIIGGLFGANIICNNLFNRNELLTIASKIEGHPDNVAPALFGNLTASMMTKEKTISLVETVSKNFKFTACIPHFEFLTSQSRKILPKEYPRKAIVYNISHSIMTFEALKSGEIEILKLALGDKLHQSFRYPLIQDSKILTDFIDNNNFIGSYLSGAGPTIIAVSETNTQKEIEILKEFCKENLPVWTIREVIPDTEGCIII